MNTRFIVDMALLALVITFIVLRLSLRFYHMGKAEQGFRVQPWSSENSAKPHVSIILIMVLLILGMQWLADGGILTAAAFFLVAGLHLFETLWKKTIHVSGFSTLIRHWKWDRVEGYSWKEDLLRLQMRRKTTSGDTYELRWHLKPGEREKVAPLLQRYLPGKETVD